MMHPQSLSTPRANLLSKASLASGRRIGYFLAAVGLVFMGWGGYLFYKEQTFLAHARHTTARVVELREIHTKFGVRRAPVFAYADTAGRPWQITSDQRAFTLGQTAGVLYPPDDPRRGQLEDFDTHRGVALLFAVSGLVIALAGYAGTGVFEYLEGTTRSP